MTKKLTVGKAIRLVRILRTYFIKTRSFKEIEWLEGIKRCSYIQDPGSTPFFSLGELQDELVNMNNDVIYMRPHRSVRLEHPNHELMKLFWIRWVRSSWPFYLCIHDSQLHGSARFIAIKLERRFTIPAWMNRVIKSYLHKMKHSEALEG